MDKSNDGYRVVIFRDGDAWVAQCLEHDICAQASDLNTVRSRIEATINAELNESPTFAGIGPAPRRFHEMWDHCTWLRGDSTTAQDDGVKIELALVA